MDYDVGKATEELENELCHHYGGRAYLVFIESLDGSSGRSYITEQ